MAKVDLPLSKGEVDDLHSWLKRTMKDLGVSSRSAVGRVEDALKGDSLDAVKEVVTNAADGDKAAGIKFVAKLAVRVETLSSRSDKKGKGKKKKKKKKQKKGSSSRKRRRSSRSGSGSGSGSSSGPARKHARADSDANLSSSRKASAGVAVADEATPPAATAKAKVGGGLSALKERIAKAKAEKAAAAAKARVLTAAAATAAPTPAAATAVGSSFLPSAVQNGGGPTGPVSSLKINARKEREEKRKELIHELTQADGEAADETADMPFRDPSLAGSSAPSTRRRRKRASFNFVKQGTHTKKAEAMRARAAFEDMAEDGGGGSGLSSGPVFSKTLEAMAKGVNLVTGAEATINPAEDVPEIEWWDEGIVLDEITNLVEHPVPIAPPAEKAVVSARKTILLEAEKRKIKRQENTVKQRELQIKIQLGIIPPPEPKVKLSSLYRVLGMEAIQNPSATEAKIIRQAQERVMRHEADNAARKLTKEERSEKRRRKLQEDTSVEVNVAVFKVSDLSHTAHKFKVDKNAQQFNLTGAGVITPALTVVVVEGGEKGIRKYTHLLLNRIKWNRFVGEETDENGNPVNNKCELVWSGVVKKRSFKGFKIHSFASPIDGAEYFARIGKNAASYWDGAMAYQWST